MYNNSDQAYLNVLAIKLSYNLLCSAQIVEAHEE